MTLALSSAAGRRALGASVVGSGLAFLDGTIVTVAAPHITADLGGGFASMQWVLDGYLLTLGALVLVGGSLGDLLGKRRVFVTGVVGFAVASAACGLAPSMAALIAARMIQGACAALLVPTSLALLNAVFTGGDRGRALGAWSGLSGICTATTSPRAVATPPANTVVSTTTLRPLISFTRPRNSSSPSSGVGLR